MRRTLIALAAACLLLGLASPVYADTTLGGDSSGGGSEGTYSAPNFQGGNADVFGSWTRQSLRCSSESCGGHLYARVTVGSLPDYLGSNTCIQIVMDWDTPSFSPGGHYDSRVVRNCKPNSTWYLSTVDGFNEPNPNCLNPIDPVIACDMPMGRVQIARFVPATQNVVDNSKFCWYRESGHTWADCEAWEQTCPLNGMAARCWIRNRDGSHFIHESGSPVWWDAKR